MTYKEQVKQLQAELASKQSILERQREELAKYNVAGMQAGFDSIRQNIKSLERQVSELELTLERILPMAQAEPEPAHIDTSKLEQDAQALLKALFELWLQSMKLAKQYDLRAHRSIPASLLVLLVARELNVLLLRIGSVAGLREIGRQAGIDWQKLRK